MHLNQLMWWQHCMDGAERQLHQLLLLYGWLA
jgi:hypothetical protein